jgi:molecular chaperone HtpG
MSEIKEGKTLSRHFKAETKQLLNILINSLYTEKDIFLRELISNAADALSRLRFETLTNSMIFNPELEPEIRIKIDKENKTITIADTGIGMNSSEIESNLGTIAHSGAKAFLDAAQDNKDIDLSTIIGQFGVGFYSAFMISERIEVNSHSFRNEDQAVKWISDGGETYKISLSDKNERGTEVTLFLKEDAKEYLEDFKLRQIIKRHSDYIPYPIYLGDSEEQVNRQTAIWRQQPHQVKIDEYNDFFKQFTLDFNDPLSYLHLSIDAPIQLYALLYIPSTPEPNIFSERKDYGLKLYARKVLIQEFTRDLLPEFLRFVQGVVDSEDIPLNVSREAFQSSKNMLQIKKTITSKVMDHIKNIAADEPEKYEKFWSEFGFFIKEGLATSLEYNDQLIPLLRFNTLNSSGKNWSFDKYTENIKPEQKNIYYFIGENFDTVLNSPHLEQFKKQKLDVLLFTDPIDSFMLMNVKKYKDWDLVNITSPELELPPYEPEETLDESDKITAENINEILASFKTVLDQKVKEVRATEQLVESPARLVDSEGSPSQELQKAYRYLQKDMPPAEKILEINPHHPIIIDLGKINGISQLRDIVIEQIYANALIVDGLQPNTSDMVKRINKIIESALNKELK